MEMDADISFGIQQTRNTTMIRTAVLDAFIWKNETLKQPEQKHS